MLLFVLLTSAALWGSPESPRVKQLQKGVVLPRVVCRMDADYSYALYLPSGYTPDRKWPVIFCFDPVGRGQLPIRLLKDAAERFGYILAGSNDSRNGPFPPILKAQQVLWKEINDRFPVDPSRTYATGFSGGSRAALLLALSHKGRFAGVISCGAFDAERKSIPRKSDMSFYMLVGNEDFNLLEFTRFDEKLTKRGHVHWLEIFDGPHRWPPQSLMLRAVEYMQADAMRRGLVPADKAFLEGQVRERLSWARRLEARGELLRAYREFHQTGLFYAGTKGADEAASAAARLSKNPRVQEAMKVEDTFEDLHARLTGATSTEDLLRALRAVDIERRHGGESARYAEILLRMSALQLSQLGGDMLRRGRYSEAAFCFETSLSVLPGDRVAAYNAACAYSRLGRRGEAVKWLRKAVENGFTNRAFIEKDPDLEGIRKEPGYAEIIDKLHE
jgi:dienelactone hydrolase